MITYRADRTEGGCSRNRLIPELPYPDLPGLLAPGMRGFLVSFVGNVTSRIRVWLIQSLVVFCVFVVLPSLFLFHQR